MNTRRYVMLKTVGGEHVRGGDVLGHAEEAHRLRDVELTVETSDLSAPEVKDAQRAPDVLRAAPVVPLTLIRPVAAEEDVDGPADVDGAAWGVAAVGAPGSTATGKGVTVAVLDTGIDAAHEAFAGRTIVQKDFTGEGDGDEHGHGTHCAGTVFGGEVGGVRLGVAPGIAKALIGKVLDHRGSGDSGQILDGLLWTVREGANVISMSIGMDFPGLVRYFVEEKGLAIEPATSMALADYRQTVRLFDSLAALVRAHSAMFADCIVVAAAGNESKRPEYEIATAPPAAADGFVSVGALQQGPGGNLLVAPFSNALPMVAGPGVDIRSARPGGGTQLMSGTSMATPHVAGVAALWLDRIRTDNPRAHMAQLEGRLLGVADLARIPAGDDRTNAGAGLVQAP